MKPSSIIRLRKRLGLTQALFAKKIGVTQSTISKWERGYPVRPMAVTALKRLKNAA